MAVMMAKCPECGEAIGGRFHRHLDTNLRIGAVDSSYNPIRYGLQNEDEIQFEDVANAIHTTRGTGFGDNGGSGKRKRRGMFDNDDDYGLGTYSLGTISEKQTTDFDRLLRQFNDMDEAPEYIVCPLSLDVYIDPVVTPNGSIYERKYIMDWLKDHDTDPLDANIKLNIQQLEDEQDVAKAARLWRQSKDIINENDIEDDDKEKDDDIENDEGNGGGLKWANNNGNGMDEHTSDDENWSGNENEEVDEQVGLNEFKSGLATAFKSVSTVNNNNSNDDVHENVDIEMDELNNKSKKE